MKKLNCIFYLTMYLLGTVLFLSCTSEHKERLSFKGIKLGMPVHLIKDSIQIDKYDYELSAEQVDSIAEILADPVMKIIYYDSMDSLIKAYRTSIVDKNKNKHFGEMQIFARNDTVSRIVFSINLNSIRSQSFCYECEESDMKKMYFKKYDINEFAFVTSLDYYTIDRSNLKLDIDNKGFCNKGVIIKGRKDLMHPEFLFPDGQCVTINRFRLELPPSKENVALEDKYSDYQRVEIIYDFFEADYKKIVNDRIRKEHIEDSISQVIEDMEEREFDSQDF